ncbi:hypothetical protein FTV88_0791 [Heliorestis convoluta]|uniref:Uncharacterized protein n=1 Tax=Heliorestis convoluta TaxID=356322 RepID=A0A5Q2MX01_9FIRM|nr:hypothetical protein FTV88_0791 [Heliorestis convoluta]
MISDEFWVKVKGKHIGAALILMLLGALLFGFNRWAGIVVLIVGAFWILYEIVKSSKDDTDKVKRD